MECRGRNNRSDPDGRLIIKAKEPIEREYELAGDDHRGHKGRFRMNAAQAGRLKCEE